MPYELHNQTLREINVVSKCTISWNVNYFDVYCGKDDRAFFFFFIFVIFAKF